MGKDRQAGTRERCAGGTAYSGFTAIRNPAFVVVFLMFFFAVTAHATEKIYWSDSGTQKIHRANSDGTNVEDVVVTGLNAPDGIAIDLPGGKLYWTDNGLGTISRSNLDGTAPEVLVTGLTTPVRIVLDTPNNKMYWTDVDTNKVQSAALDGTGVTDIVTGAGAPWGIDIDRAAQRLYFTERDADRIIRVNVDGTLPASLINVIPSTFGSVKLLTSADGMYWTDRTFTGRRLSAATFIGTEVDLDRWILAPDLPDGMDIDQAEKTAYMTTRNAPKILTMALDGTGSVVTLLDSTDGLDSPRDIALVKNQSPVADAGLGVRIQEGADATFDASASSDPDGSPLYYAWDIDNDGDFDDATGVTPVVPWSTISGLGLTNGVSLVRVEVSDGIDKTVALTALTIANDLLYWSDIGSHLIQSTDLTGTGVTDVYFTGPAGWPLGMGYDPVEQKIYWTNRDGSDSLARSDLDGSNFEVLIAFTFEAPHGVSIDVAGRKMYYTLSASTRIARADLDGANEQILQTFGTGSLADIEVNPVDGKYYYADASLGTISRANLDGTGVQLIAVGRSGPRDVAIDSVNNRVYWTESTAGAIAYRDFDNAGGVGSITTLVTGLSDPRALSVDSTGSRLYWTDRATGEIYTRLTTGTAPFQPVVSGLIDPRGMVLLENTRPQANAGGGYTINEGADLFLDASGTVDTEGGPLTYAWDLDNDGEFDDATGINPTVDWATLASLGVVDDVNPIAVEVMDTFVTGSAATTLTIVNLPPNANAGGPYNINEGSSLVLDATGTSDPGGDAIGLYEWDLDGDLDFDDAIGAQPTVPWNALRTAGLGNGTNTIRVRVTDTGNVTNLSDTSSTLLTVANLPPITDVFERSITKIQVLDEPAPGFLAAVTDPGGDPISIVSWDTESVFGATVTVNQATGAFTYDPSSSTTLLRLHQSAEVVDSFTYVVQDSESSTKAQVTGVVNVIVSGDSGIPAVGLLGRLGLAIAVAAFGGLKLRRSKR